MDIIELDELRGKIALYLTAVREGRSEDEVLKEAQAAIDAAWSRQTLSDAPENTLHRKLFPEGKPSPALFVGRIGRILKQSKK